LLGLDLDSLLGLFAADFDCVFALLGGLGY